MYQEKEIELGGRKYIVSNDGRVFIGEKTLQGILLTHGHYDHYASAGIYLETYPGVTFAAPSGETYLLHGGRDNKWMAISHGGATCPEAQLLFLALCQELG